MIRVFVIDDHRTSKQNGVGTYVRNLLECLTGVENLEVHLISFNSDEERFTIEAEPERTEYKIPVCGNQLFLLQSPLSLTVLRMYIQDRKENLFLVNHSPSEGLIRTLRKLFPLSKVVYVLHDQGWTAPLLGDTRLLETVLNGRYIPLKSKKTWKFVREYCAREKKMYRQVDAIVTLAADTVRVLRDIYRVPENKIFLIPNGARVSVPECTEETRSVIRQKWGFGPDEILLLFTGRTVYAKGIQALLKAFEQIWPECPKMRLIIAGQVFHLNEFSGLTPHSVSHITYTGLISSERLNELYQISDICLLPSYTEQCSYTGIEMLAHGKLIVTSDGHCLSGMFPDEVALKASITDADRNVDEGFTSSLAQTLLKAVSMTPEEKNKMCEKARERFLMCYTLPLMKQRYLDFFEKYDEK